MHTSLYDWIIYKRGSKAKEKERGGQAALLEVLYDLASRDRNPRQFAAICLVTCQYRNAASVVTPIV